MPHPDESSQIFGKSLTEFFDDITRFHGHMAPGLVLGGVMVDWAQELIRAEFGPQVEADAIVETVHCLPDAVQIFTPCTVGNGWLRVLDWDKYALTLYHKKALAGHRVWLDLQKAQGFPNLYNWYMHRVSKQDLPLPDLLDTIVTARRSALSHQMVEVTHFYGPRKKAGIDVCPGCGEAYPVSQGTACLSCQGNGYYCSRK
jgi:formylmethanofuran dehydrogenase subunit E